MTSSQPRERIEDWSRAIGDAFVAFGIIEHLTIIGIHLLPKERIAKSVSGFRLKQRIDLLLEILEHREGDDFRQLKADLEAVLPLIQTRNLLAHNPILVERYVFDDGTTERLRVLRRFDKNHTRLELREAKAFALKAAAVQKNLEKSAWKIFNAPLPVA